MVKSKVVAVVGGACAGSEIASKLAALGMQVIVFEQNPLPYGKIEDGLPCWHKKMQDREMSHIDEKLSHEKIQYVPNCALGKDIQLDELFDAWGLNLVVMATGAWRDRALNVKGVSEITNDSFVYQNAFVYWFNHQHEPHFNGKRYRIGKKPVIIGGGLASIDMAKICQFQRVIEAMKERGHDVELLELEHKGVHKVCEAHGVAFDDLGIHPAKIIYRKRVEDMPLVPLPDDADEQRLIKAESTRVKLVNNGKKRYDYDVLDLRSPVEIHHEAGTVSGLTIQRNKYEAGRFTKMDAQENIETDMIISSIGSIPEPIKGIEMDGELFKWNSRLTGEVSGYKALYCVGNAVTGRGNIKDSSKNAKRLGEIIEAGVHETEVDYDGLFKAQAEKAKAHVDKILQIVHDTPDKTETEIEQILKKTANLQKTSNFENYQQWRESILGAR